MSDLLVDLATLLDGALPWTAGTDLFVGAMPDGDDVPDALTVLYEYPGPPPIETAGPGLPAVIMPRIQVSTRGVADDYAGSRARARAAYGVLAIVANETINGSYYARIAALQEPFLLSNDESGRFLFAFNCQVWREHE